MPTPRQRRVALWTVTMVVIAAAVLGALSLRSRRQRGSQTVDESSAVADLAAPRPSPSLPPDPPRQPPPAPTPTPPAPSLSAHRRLTMPPDAGRVPFDEGALMAKLRDLSGNDPPLTLRLARAGNAASPDSPEAPERAWMVVKSLVNMQRFKEAHDEAEKMVARYPGTEWAFDVQRHLLSNPLD